MLPLTTTRVLTSIALSSSMLTGAAAAAHADPITVVAGSQTTGSAAFTADTVPPGVVPPDLGYEVYFGIPLIDTQCVDSQLSGTFTLGPQTTPAKIGEITQSSFNGCTFPLSLPMRFTQHGVWDIVAEGGPADGATPVAVRNISMHADDLGSDDPGTMCSFDVSGALSGRFTEASQSMSLSGSTLTISNVIGCFGIVVEGDPATLAATYAVATPSGPLLIG